MKLDRRFVEKPWGRTDLPAVFGAPAGKRIGEIWFTGAADLPLLTKYIFTNERLSIQVHPKEKTECWLILDAEAGATIGLGFRHEHSREEIRAAALDGSIEQLLDWHPARAGDFYLVPPGTVHAIGGGLSLLEFQQNCDITYRLYDYGRPRELHVDEAIAVADPRPYPAELAQHLDDNEECVLVEGPSFTLIASRTDRLTDHRRWVLPLEGESFGDCFLLEPAETLGTGGARILIGAHCA